MQFLTFLQNHWVLATILVVFIVAFAFFEMWQHFLGPKRMPPSLATQFMNRQNPVVLDIRDKGKFDGGHIINAHSVMQAEVENTLKKLKKSFNDPILLVCQTGQQSAMIGARLKKQGFTAVVSLAGGMTAWKNAELPTEKR